MTVVGAVLVPAGMPVYCTGVESNTLHGSASVPSSTGSLIRRVCLCTGVAGSVSYSTVLLSIVRGTVSIIILGKVPTAVGP